MSGTFFGTLMNKNRAPFAIIWFGWMVSSILGLLENLVNICTLCTWFPGWQMTWLFFYTKWEIDFERNRKLNKLKRQAKRLKLKPLIIPPEDTGFGC